MSIWLNFDLHSSNESPESPYLGIFTMKPTDIAARIPRPIPPFVKKPLCSERSSDSDTPIDEIPTLSVRFNSFAKLPLVC